MSALRRDDAGDGPVREEKPLSAARQALAAANQRVDELSAEIARLAEPANRLAEISGRASAAETRHAALYTADTARLAQWLTAAEGDRPLPSEELLAVERELVQLRRDREAAELAAPAAQERYVECHGRLTAVARDREALLCQAAADAALAYIDSTLRPRIRAALLSRVVIESLVEVLGFGPGAGNGGTAAADRIRAVLIPVLKTAAPRDSDAAREFLNRLRKDPAAELE